VVGVGPRLHVPTPPVPRANGHAALEIALAQRPPTMRAGVVESVEGPVHVEEGERLPLRVDHAPFPRGDVRHRGHEDARAHAVTGSASPARSHSLSRPAFLTPTSKWSHGMVSSPDRTRRV